MKLKKLMSLGMAVVMTAALAVPAFAEDPKMDTTITATYKAITINVDVPADTTATINPYKLPIDITKSDTTTKVQITGQQIVTQPTVALKNKMGMDMNVSVTATGAITALADTDATPMRFATEAITAETTIKSAYVYVQAKAGTYKSTDDTGDTANAVADKIIDDYVAWTASAYNADTDILVKAGATTKENIITLKAAAMDTAANGGGFKAFNEGSIGLLRVTGQVVTSPRDAWTAADGFSVKLAYTIMPAETNT